MRAAKGFEVGGRVDVGDRGDFAFNINDASQFAPAAFDLGEVGHVGHRAAGREVGQDGDLVRRGHDVGDLVLKEMADIFSGLCEKQGFVCRYGGDEYIIVFFTADKERLKETAKQIYQKIDQADGFEKAISEKLKKQISIRKEQRISCSIGIVLAEDIHGEEEINQMIKRADDLLYSIKTTKKGTYRI